MSTGAELSLKLARLPLKNKTPLAWWICFALALTFLGVFGISLTYLLIEGPGIWGNNRPVYWAYDLTNFIWWIGLGHAGTFLSAVFILLEKNWRVSVSRLAEGMTIFAVMCAGLFPLIHLGRPWLAYWVFPYPNSMNVYSNFRSPFVWDAFAIATYITVSMLFWFIGMIPDFAMIRDEAKPGWKRTTYGLLAFGWKGERNDWRKMKSLSLLLAAIATPLVVSVHSTVALDFASAIVPGWSSTVFPPFFVAGAVFSGLAMVLMLAVFIRSTFDIRDAIRIDHLDRTAQFLLATCWMVTYSYALEVYSAWYSGDVHEWNVVYHKMFGHYWFIYWGMLILNVVLPQAFWFRAARRNTKMLFWIGLAVVIGMWFERFTVIIPTLEAQYLKTAWRDYFPTIWDWGILSGTIGLFSTCYLIYVRWAPIVPIREMREYDEGESE